MPKNSEIKKLEKSEEVESSSSSSDNNEEINQTTSIKKEKKPYVMTEARKIAFEKARMKREENLKLKKELKEKEQEHIKLLKEKATNKKQKKIQKLNKEIEESIEDLQLHEKTLELHQKKLPQLECDDYVFESHDSRLEAIERIYKKNKDLDELKRLVHYTCELLDKYLFGKDYVAPYKDHPLTWENAPKKFKDVMMEDYMPVYKDEQKTIQEIKKKINKMNTDALRDWYNNDW